MESLEDTSLLVAAANSHEAVVRLLIEKGASVQSRNKDGWSAGQNAAENGHEVIVLSLL